METGTTTRTCRSCWPDAAAAVGAVARLERDPTRSVPLLLPDLKDSDWTVRKSAAVALGKLGPQAKSALPALRKLLSDDSQRFRTFLERTIQTIEGTTSAPR